MIPYFVSYYGNPHSRTHAYGWESEAAVEKARKVSTYICYLYDGPSIYNRTVM